MASSAFGLVHYSSDSSQDDQEEQRGSLEIAESVDSGEGSSSAEGGETIQQPPVPPESTKKRRPYAAELSELSPDLRQFLGAVETFFTQKINLERQRAALSNSTYSKAQERMLCKFWQRIF